MSKLFDAINRLEGDGAQGVINSPFKSGVLTHESTSKGQGPPKGIVATIIIVAVALAGGLAALYLTEEPVKIPSKINSAFVAKEGVKGPQSAPEVKTKTQHARAAAERVVKKEPTAAAKMHAAVKSDATSEAVANLQEKNNAKKGVVTGKAAAPRSSIKDKLSRNIPRGKTTLLVKTTSPVKTRARVLNGHMKRLLYQAERLRKKGATTQALGLYRQIWMRTKNPLVANNLAGLLMEQGEYREAESVLKEALKASPADKDLAFNLQQVRHFLQNRAMR
ncbi:MAG: tetratricopeptide repeat protein [Thermodesulfobacteria bacterium]|nr:tetratricopeptide repeat protein [Thermodesulfobacteriota bacterium]